MGLQVPYGRASRSHAVYLPPTAGDRCVQKAKVGSCPAPPQWVAPHPPLVCATPPPVLLSPCPGSPAALSRARQVPGSKAQLRSSPPWVGPKP